LPLLVDREEQIFSHGHSMHPIVHATVLNGNAKTARILAEIFPREGVSTF